MKALSPSVKSLAGGLDAIAFSDWYSCQIRTLDSGFPGADDLVQRLHALGIPMALATSSSAAMVQSKRQNHSEMFDRFRVIVTGDDADVKHGKPAPDIFLVAAKRLGIDARRCLAFEDSPYGVQSAKAAGMQVVAIPDSSMDKQRFHEADRIIDSLVDFAWSDWKFASSVMKADSTNYN